jgi:hypothetical protein
MSLLQSDPRIYKTMQSPEDGALFRQLDGDYGGKFGFLQEQGYMYDATDGRWRVPMMGRSLLQPTPWCHAKHAPDKHCAFDHNLVFNNFEIIPPRCLQCWKVVVTPRTFDELMQLEQLQLQMDVPCKCGIELRDYTPKHYGGYWYNSSLDEGRDKYETVKKLVSEHISKELGDTTILKRGCTEYEMIKGPAPYWHMTNKEEQQLEIIASLVDVPRGNTEQSEVTKKATRIKWFVWAHMNGDMSYTKYNGGVKLFPDYVHFEEGDIDDIKKDMIAAQNHAKYGTPMEATTDMLKQAEKIAKKHKLPTVGGLIGGEAKNPFAYTVKDIPEGKKGDHDVLS